jgi:hypothetical protein
MRVGDDRQAAVVGFGDDDPDFVGRHLILVDQLDDVDAGVRELAHLRAGVLHSRDAPSKELGAWIRGLLDERAGDVDGRAVDRAGPDAVANGDAGLERTTEIACARDAGQQELFGGGGHDHRFELRRIGLVPVGVVAVPVDHEVHVHVP